jgi:hypothetical protein
MEAGVRQYFVKGKYILAGAAFVVFAVACSAGVRDSRLPQWAVPGGFTEAAAPVRLQGKWTLNESLSDDSQQLMNRAVEALIKERRTVISGESPQRGPGRSKLKIGEDVPMPGDRDPYGAVSDSRLAALRAKSILIDQDESMLSFTFNDAAPVSYLINQATSTDQNINLTFADWEGSQLVVEKNGPDGLVLERWILSPDASQLYLLVSMEIKLPDFPLPAEPLLIGRMFDKIR